MGVLGIKILIDQIEKKSPDCIHKIVLDPRLEIRESCGCKRRNQNYKDRVTYMNTDGVTVQCVEWFFEYWEPTFLSEMKDFLDCIIQDRQPLVGLDDGYKAVEWAYAATDAVKNKKIVYMD
jgi:predicted dehydrogenase